MSLAEQTHASGATIDWLSGAGAFVRRNASRIPWIVIGIALVVWSVYVDENHWAVNYPKSWIIPLKFWLSDLMKWLINECSFGLFTFKELTRSFSWLLNWPLEWATGILFTGLTVSFDLPVFPAVDFTIPHLPWTTVLIGFCLVAYYKKGVKLALLSGFSFLYLAVFGQWESAMQTMASTLISVPVGIFAGLFLGILASRSKWAVTAITPLLDLMQTVPVFAYLVPILFLFGFGPVSAMIATIIYATPPMVRCTLHGLQSVPTTIVESGRIMGCSRRQLLWKVRIPSAMPDLMVGLNQVIMLSLNMVIIASMIGAGGLGYDVLTALRRLKIGVGLEAGIAIVVLAITFDRISQTFSKRTAHEKDKYNKSPMQFLLIWVAAVVVVGILSQYLPALHAYPEKWFVTTEKYWDGLVRYININYYESINVVRSFLLIHIMMPTKRFLLDIPWLTATLFLAFLGYRVGKWKLCLLVTSLTLFMAVTGYWEKSMITVYLCGIGVIIAAIIGISVGIWASRHDNFARGLYVVLDTLQTLPTFVYLIPVVMLFSVGDFSALIAIVAYAVVPAVRYTYHGIRQVPDTVIQAAKASGCTKTQILFKVQLPMAFPDILLGVNQTIMMALSMLVITALVGTRDLGQEVYIALTKADTGRGLVAGLCVAFIAIISDRLIQGWAIKKKKAFGLEI